MSARASVLRHVRAYCVADHFCGLQGFRVWMRLPDRSWWSTGFLCGTRRAAWIEAWEKVQALASKRKHKVD